MLKKFREYFSQKGQGVVEYALLLGFVAVILVGFTSSNGLIGPIRTALSHIKDQFTTFNEAYENADNNNNNNSGGGVVETGEPDQPAG